MKRSQSSAAIHTSPLTQTFPWNVSEGEARLGASRRASSGESGEKASYPFTFDATESSRTLGKKKKNNQ